MRFDPTNPDANPDANNGAVFPGHLSGGEFNGRQILGNFSRRKDAVALAEARGGKVEAYLSGKYKRGWLVWGASRPAVPAPIPIPNTDSKPGPLDLSKVSFDFSTPKPANPPPAPAVPPAAPVLNIIAVDFPKPPPCAAIPLRPVPDLPSWRRGKLPLPFNSP